jgi:prolyl-tRNA synthetase
VGFKGKIYADHSVVALSDFVCGANKKDAHLTGVNWVRDLPEAADRIFKAVDEALSAGARTADLGGSLTTRQMGDAILKRL